MLCSLVERCQQFGGNLLPLASILKMDVARSSETLVPFYQVSWRHYLEDIDLHIHYCENLKSHTSPIFRYAERHLEF
jgi:hypothetical protein